MESVVITCQHTVFMTASKVNKGFIGIFQSYCATEIRQRQEIMRLIPTPELTAEQLERESLKCGGMEKKTEAKAL